MYYVYILKHPTEDRIYIGFSTDLRARMQDHQPRASRLETGLLRSLRFRSGRQGKRTTTERLRQRKTVVAQTNHAESADGLK